MKKILKVIFIVLIILTMIFPFALKPFVNTDITIGNEKAVEKPVIKNEDGTLNVEYIPSLGEYFEKTFAFRDKFITLDGLVQSKVFKTSNTNEVLVGSNDMFYYKSSIDDYKGISTFSNREAFNLVHNLKLIQNYVYSIGSKFVFTIAPNKNSLYKNDMPYYEKISVNDIKNHDVFNKALNDSDVNYLNLFELFDGKKDLYLKHDSHWNNKTALDVYNNLLDRVKIDHDKYDDAKYEMKPFAGDLYAMIYPSLTDTEENFEFDINPSYKYEREKTTVEDGEIKSFNESKENNLLMYRDSFANSLIPYFSNNFKEAHYSKGIPQNIVMHTLNYQPNLVIIEKAERNVRELITTPPVISPIPINLFISMDKIDTNTKVEAKTLETYTPFYEISGTVDEKYIDDNTEIFVKVKNKDNIVNIYEAYQLDKNGFTVYLEKENIENEFTVDAQIITKNNEEFKVVQECTLKIS